LYGRRTDAALGENTFIKTTNDTLDMYLAQGKAVLDNLTNQRDVMKGMSRTPFSVSGTALPN
jgi:Golgi SNAP receptor complex protein 2